MDANVFFFPPFFFYLFSLFLVDLLRSLSSSTIYLYGYGRSQELAGDESRLLSDRAGRDILNLDFSYF